MNRYKYLGTSSNEKQDYPSIMCMRSADSFPLLALKDYASATEVLCSWVRVRARAQWAKVFLKSQLVH